MCKTETEFCIADEGCGQDDLFVVRLRTESKRLSLYKLAVGLMGPGGRFEHLTMWVTNGNDIVVPAVWATTDYLNLKLNAESTILGTERDKTGRTTVVTGRYADVTMFIPLANKLACWYEVRVAFSKSIGNRAEIGIGALNKDFIVNHHDDRLQLTRRNPMNRRITVAS